MILFWVKWNDPTDNKYQTRRLPVVHVYDTNYFLVIVDKKFVKLAFEEVEWMEWGN